MDEWRAREMESEESVICSAFSASQGLVVVSGLFDLTVVYNNKMSRFTASLATW